MTGPDAYDVVQIGYGPVGQVMSALLGRAGHRVAVFERWPDAYPLPRAGHIDDEIMRIFQGIGAADEFEKSAVPVPAYDWFNGERQLLLHMDWSQPTLSGWQSHYLMYQPEMEDALTGAAARFSSVSVVRGWEAVAIEECSDHVEVRLREGCLDGDSWVPTGNTRTVTAQFVIGSDGAMSFTRRHAAIPWDDLGFEEDWLVVDIRPRNPDVHIDMPDAGQICDPQRPISLFRWLGRSHCRWEFMMLAGETTAEMTRDEQLWSLLEPWNVTAREFDIVRSAVYTFRSLLARRFRKDRVLLVGDAAHLMPPFIGQGMCSGIRDAANLAWKLDLVLRGVADAALLDTYTIERRPHVEQVIRMSMELGRIVCIVDPDAAAERDKAFFADEAPLPPPFPSLASGVLHGGAGGALVGHLGVQGRIVSGGMVGRADDLLGGGWSVLSVRAGATEVLSPDQAAFLKEIGARVVHVSQAAVDSEFAVVDIDATYARWFAQLGADVIMIRPDHYIYGLAGRVEEFPGLVDELRGQLCCPAAVCADSIALTQ